MNAVEERAHRWLAEYTGYPKDRIIFHRDTSPDFTTPDGKGYEVKRVKTSHHVSFIVFGDKQWLKLWNNRGDTFILIYSDGDSPETIIPMYRLPIGTKRCEGLRIAVYRDTSALVDRATYLSLLKQVQARFLTQETIKELLRRQEEA